MATPNDMLGTIGEFAVKGLAARAGFTVNAPDDDKRGWDALIEIDAPSDRTVPLDRRTRGLKAFVQVKTTRKEKHVDVSLTNLELACSDTNPWFFVIVIVDKKNNAKAMYLVPLDEALIARVLKRLREATIKGEASVLHKRQLSITWSETHKVPVKDAEAFRERVLLSVGDVATYATRKEQTRQRVGYERGHSLASIQFGPGVSNSLVAEAMVGLYPELPVARMRVEDIRFDLPVLSSDMKDGTLTFKPISRGVSTLAVQRADGTRTALQMETYVASGVARLANDYFSIIVRTGWSVELAVHIPHDPTSLANLEESARALVALADDSARSVSIEVLNLGEIEAKPGVSVPRDILDGLTVCIELAETLARLGHADRRDRVSFANVLSLKPYVDAIRAALAGERTTLSMVGPPADLSQGIVLVSIAVVLDARFIVCITALTGDIESADEAVKVAGHASIKGVKSFPIAEQDFREQTRSWRQSVAGKLAATEPVLFVNNLYALQSISNQHGVAPFPLAPTL